MTGYLSGTVSFVTSSLPLPKPQENEPESKPHYYGHRDRSRERLFAAGPEALQDCELLEILLFAAIPSRDDIEMTRAIADACRPLGIAIHDHIIVGRDEVASFKALGLL